MVIFVYSFGCIFESVNIVAGLLNTIWRIICLHHRHSYYSSKKEYYDINSYMKN